MTVFVTWSQNLFHFHPLLSLSACERTLHTECVLKIGSSKEFEEKCQPDELLKCLRNAMLSNVCTVQDSDTLPTIKQLISYVERKFKKDPKFCQEKRKLKSFVERLQDTFKGMWRIFIFDWILSDIYFFPALVDWKLNCLLSRLFSNARLLFLIALNFLYPN